MNERRNVLAVLLTLSVISVAVGVTYAFQSGIITFNFRITDSKQLSTNIITNPSFEQDLNRLGYPLGWSFETCEGVADATVSVDSSLSVNGTYSAKIFTGPVTDTYCFPMNGTRILGFTQFRQFLRPGLTFADLTDGPGGFSFWFYLQPYSGTSMGGFVVRILGVEASDELDYVFNPHPSLTYPNATDPTTGKGLRSLLFSGYQFGQWYQFSRNLRSDWEQLGLGLTSNFSIIQFQGMAYRNADSIESETFWLDDVRVYIPMTT